MSKLYGLGVLFTAARKQYDNVIVGFSLVHHSLDYGCWELGLNGGLELFYNRDAGHDILKKYHPLNHRAVDFIQTEVDFEQPVNRLDGTWHLMPDAEAANFNEAGWWGDAAADLNSIIPGDQGLLVSYTARRVTSFQVVGDDQRNEFPVDFTVEFHFRYRLIGDDWRDCLLVGKGGEFDADGEHACDKGKTNR